MKKILSSLLVAVLLLGGCTTSPQSAQSPEKSVYAVTAAYAGVLSIAVTYKNLPSCDLQPRPALCSDKNIVKKLQDADNVAFAAITAAQNIVRSPSPVGMDAQTAINAANEALVAFTSIATALQVK